MAIGLAEANGIALPLENRVPPRPLTHDLFLTLFGRLRVTVTKVVITDLRDDIYYATDGHCTHEKTLLCDGLVMGGIIECPKHNGRFDYTSGQALGAPVLADIRTYPVKVIDGTVFIEVS